MTGALGRLIEDSIVTTTSIPKPFRISERSQLIRGAMAQTCAKTKPGALIVGGEARSL